ncbi:MAG: FdtA/QdtA family cupin domain-containing protein [Firmicutes bacterium]|nr:FdtA/QdtA family cupin domain-containing protein [Bacillota bacterium]MCM1401612.1 FdtA/QdtA family cupin domain-containing protein [Bacteroides sp.]MCM1477769.1 FdtA/QdtA family cupin domain-containing protein [Bacteroides sp.]
MAKEHNTATSSTSPLQRCSLVSLPVVTHPGRGSLSIADNAAQLPLNVKRIFYIYDIPAGVERGGHAHHSMNELIVAVTGCVDVEITDGTTEKTITLRHPSQALFLPAGIWRSLCRFSAGCVVLSLCDTDYNEADYIRDFNEYLQLKNT